MHADEVTLAEVLKGAGYRTGIFGKWHLGDCYPMRAMDQGFDESLIHNGGGIKQPSDPPGSSYVDPILFQNGVEKKFEGYCTDVYGDHALKFMEAERERPFFLYFATNAPHTPLEVPEAWVRPYREMGLDEVTAKVYAMCENIDRNVGRILAKLEELKIAENTIVLYLHDNGAQQRRFNGGLRATKGTVYEGGIRSPLFVRWKGHSPALKTDYLAAHIDVMPTVLELCGVEPPAVKFDGHSLAPVVLGHKVERADRTVYLQWHRGDVPVPHRQAAAVRHRFKLVDGKELYDLQADPGETKDLAAAHPEVVERMRKEYDAWFADVTSARRFDPGPKIVLGSEKQNPVTLTRQDWRGAKAGWTAESVGHWEVSIAGAGEYDLTVRFAAMKEDGELRMRVGEVVRTAKLSAGMERQTFAGVTLLAGEARVEPTIDVSGKTLGVQYVDVRKRD